MSNRLLPGLVLVLTATRAAAADPPAVPREFRGVWVATVANIDWPSKKGLPAAQQQAELRALLDRAVALKLNAIVFQVRPMCDALYKSDLEPWSEFLTGTLGKDPGYDPLELAVAEAHARGLELHAWFNPYRAKTPTSTSAVPDSHLVKKQPDLAKPYGKHFWLNPTNPEVADHSLKVILDVVRRYDVDGVHLDDYFYPYTENDGAGKPIPFPDDDTWAAYQKAGGKLSRDDWRRDAVDRFVERLYAGVKKEKKWVQVGISPFGIWRPGNPPGIEGFDQFGKLYADPKKWFREGWVDYLTPQLYWPIAQTKQSYPKLLAWWAEQNPKKRHLWPGNIPSRVTGKEKGWPPSEIADQIKATRAQPGATGNIHFSMKPLMHNTGGVADAIAKVYQTPALVPASPWLDNQPPAKPTVIWDAERKEVRVKPVGEPVRLFVIHKRTGDQWSTTLQPADGARAINVRFVAAPDEVRVSVIDRVGNEGPAASVVPGK